MAKTWLLATAIVGVLAAPSLAQDDELDPRKREIVNKLNNQRITIDFKDVALDEALNFIRDFTGINIVIDGKVHEKLSEDQLKITIRVKDLLLKSALKLMLNSRELTAVYREGVLVIQPKDAASMPVVTRVYDARDLLFKLQDFPGPKVELVSPSGGGTPLTGATFALEEEPSSVITEDFLTEIIQANTGDGSWDDNPNASITLTNGLLIVTQTRKVHGEVDRLMNLLRQFK